MLRTAIAASRARARALPPRCIPLRRPFSATPQHPANRYLRFDGDPHDPNNIHAGKEARKQARNQLTTLVATGIGLAGGLYYVTHLETVPQTGRRRFMNVSEKWEARIGEEARNDILSEYGHKVLPPNHPVSQRVRHVVTKLLEANKLGSIKGEVPSSPSAFGEDTWNPDESIRNSLAREWDVIVVHDQKIVNAAAMPGTIVLFTGILPVCRDDEGLAAVLAHEVGHVVARHSAEKVSSATLAWVAILAISAITSLDLGFSNMAHTLLFDLPNSRAQETEADVIGLTLMSRACYDPKAAPAMFKRLGELERRKGSSGYSFLNTHPATESRVEALEEKLPDAYAVLAASPDCGRMMDSYQRFKSAGFLGTGIDRDLW